MLNSIREGLKKIMENSITGEGVSKGHFPLSIFLFFSKWPKYQSSVLQPSLHMLQQNLASEEQNICLSKSSFIIF